MLMAGEWSGVEGLVDRYAPGISWLAQALSRQGQGSLAIRISSSRQLQMVRQARQVGSPKVSRPGRQENRQMEFASHPSRRPPTWTKVSYVNF